MMKKILGLAFFFLEHSGELRINILRRKKKGETPIHQSKVLLKKEGNPGKTPLTQTKLNHP
jgi:hypothetical protein